MNAGVDVPVIDGTFSKPILSRLLTSIVVPSVVDGDTVATLSGRPSVLFPKCVNLPDTTVCVSRMYEPSSVPIRNHASLPLPAVDAVDEPKSELVSSRCDSRQLPPTSMPLTGTKVSLPYSSLRLLW